MRVTFRCNDDEYPMDGPADFPTVPAVGHHVSFDGVRFLVVAVDWELWAPDGEALGEENGMWEPACLLIPA